MSRASFHPFAVRLALLLLGCTGLGASRPPGLMVVPELQRLGVYQAGRDATTCAWLINTGERPIEITEAVIDHAGLTLIAFEPKVLRPSTAREIRLALRAPEDVGIRARGTVTFRSRGHGPVTLAVEVEAGVPDVILPPTDIDVPYGAAVRAAPHQLRIGEAAPGERRRGTLWLVNTIDTPVTVTEAKAGCGCVELDSFDPVTLRPSEAAAFGLTMLAQGEPGHLQRKTATFLIDNGDTVTVAVLLSVVDPLITRLQRYLAARDRGDGPLARAHLAPDSRVWHGTRTGPGTARDAAGAAPGAAWDRALHVTRTYDEFQAEDREVSLTIHETNDFDRLLDRAPRALRATYWFDEEDNISGLLIEPVEPDPTFPDRFDALRAWAAEHRPAELESLYRGGEIQRSAESARRWRALLVEWRHAMGLPPPSTP